MMEDVMSPTCEQSNELIAFLYGELSDVESQAFQTHIDGCRSCGKELEGFSGVRRSVIAWRDESLGGVSAPAATYYAAAAVTDREKPSALAALREFFRLSPLWMKGAVAFATVLFCLFAGLMLARLGNNPSAPIANNSASPTNTAYSDQQLNAIVEQRVHDELQRIRDLNDKPALLTVTDGQSSRVSTQRLATRNDVVSTNSPARRPLSKVEREQLAADLRLVAANSDSDLDLLDDRINQ